MIHDSRVKNKTLEIGNWTLEIGNSCLRKAGFTLLELLLFMGLFSILLLVLTTTFTTALDSRLESQSVSNVGQDARFLLIRLEHDIKNAQSITTPLQSAQSNQLVATINNNTYTYTLSNGTLNLTNQLGTNALNNFGTTITNINFQRFPNGEKDSIIVSFTISSNTTKVNGVESKTFSETIDMR